MLKGATVTFMVSTITVTALGLAGFAFAPAAAANPAPATHIIDIRRLQFEPMSLTVALGDTVVWINRDIVPHTVNVQKGQRESGHLEQDDSWRVTATASDTLPYYCTYHPTMRGTVIVKGG